jgi:hypothetical protein
MSQNVSCSGGALMMQRFTRSIDGTITVGDTARHAFPAATGGILYVRAGASNAGTVTIGSPKGTAGIPLAAGEWHPVIGPIQELEYVGYQFSTNNGTDVLNYWLIG